MRNQKGKRKAETNYVPPYSGASELPPPPTRRDEMAVSSKLRRIFNPQWASKGNAKEGKATVVKSFGVRQSKTEWSPGNSDQPPKLKRAFASKWKKGEEELKMRIEKMDKRSKSTVRAGVGERRKSFLQKKRNKKRGKGKDSGEDVMPSLERIDKIEFGDVVQAPPKLSFPRKAAEVKLKENGKRIKGVYEERLRLGAIDMYRKRKHGQQLPVLTQTSDGGLQ